MTQRRIGLIGLLLCAAFSPVLGACSPGSSSEPQVATQAPYPAAGNVPEVVSAEAIVVPYQEANLAFSMPGRLQQLLVSEGDEVTAGQPLATVETRDLELAVRRAQAALAVAKAQRDKAKAGARQEEVELAKAGVTIAQDNLAAAEATLDSAQAGLDKVVAGPTARDIQIAGKQVELAKSQLWAAQAQRDVIGGQMNKIPPLATQVDYEAAKAQVAAAESQVEIAQLQLQGLQAGARAEDIAAARAQVAQAKANVQIAEAQLQQAQAQLSLVEAGSRTEDVAAAEATVAQAEVGLTEAQNALDDAVLRAPFDGMIAAIHFHEGELVSPQMPVMQLGNVSRWRVRTLDLSEADVNSLQVGQEATVTVDAWQGAVLKGTIERVASVATERRGQTVYEVTVDLGLGPESGLRWGMSAFVEITLR